MNDLNFSRYLSYILRHNPSDVHIELDNNGWADVSELISKINAYSKYNIILNDLIRIVEEDNKQRYSFSKDGNKIRANQGHSIKVNLELKPKNPPKELYHGTATRFLENIKEKGILPMTRQYVHLSDNIKTAEIVGKRHGIGNIVLVLDTELMLKYNYEFYLSENGVWLVDKVILPKYIKEILWCK